MRLSALLAVCCLALALLPPVAGAGALPEPRDPAWSQLNPAQQQALAPLQSQWPQFGPTRKRKWLAIAARYPKLNPGQQATLQRRMAAWAGMSPQQRRQARQNFLATRKTGAQQRKQAWDQYQSLSPAQRQALATAARTPPRKPLPVHSYGIKRQRPASTAAARPTLPAAGASPPAR